MPIFSSRIRIYSARLAEPPWIALALFLFLFQATLWPQTAAGQIGTSRPATQASDFRFVLVDPVTDLIDQEGTGVVRDRERLATGGTPVRGVAVGDGVGVVVRIYAHFAGQHLRVALQGDGVENLNGLQQPLGTLYTLLRLDGTASGS